MADVTNKADGVFLWVILVVASLKNGLRDGDTIEDLWQRLQELPSKLEELFRKILNNINPVYLAQACAIFQLVLAAVAPLTLLDISLGLEGCTVAIEAPLGQMKQEELEISGRDYKTAHN
jgi:hypothetical protein